MKIDGKMIADRMLEELSQEVSELKQKGITPTLAVILVGDNPDSLSYIKSKQKSAETIGAKIILDCQPYSFSLKELKVLIEKYNNDPKIHGLIVQRPIPQEVGDATDVLKTVSPQKDVDGFVPNSAFQVPVAKAVLTVLKEIYSIEKQKNPSLPNSVEDWLKQQCVAVVGRGETAGKPIADLFAKHGCTISVVHSLTQHPEEVLKTTPIIISCVGKPNTITKGMVTPRSIVIGVGIWWDSNGKIHGDYQEEDILDLAAYYTPTPGGIGPVNVACLMQNLVQSAQ